MLYRILFNFHDVVLLITAYLCVLFALLVLTRKEKALRNILLAAFLLCHAAIPLDTLISFGAGFRPWAAENAPSLFYIFGYAYWWEAPILLWYVRSLLYKDFSFTYYDALFMLPFAIYMVGQLPFLAMSSDEQSKILANYSLFKTDTWLRIINVHFREVTRLGFMIACVSEVSRYQKRIQHEFSNIERINFNWLFTMVVGFTVLMVWQLIVVLMLELNVGFHLPVEFETLGIAGNYAMLGLISLLIFFNLSHSVVFDGIKRDAETKTEHNKKKPEFHENDLNRLETHMLEEKPYLQNDLTVNELASQLSFTARQLSSMVNRHFEKNFFEFVNYYRIEEAKSLLLDPEKKNTTVLEIMYASGFNSKATFNTFFKKHTNMTPRQFRKKQ